MSELSKLITDLKSEDDQSRVAAAEAICLLGEEAGPAAVALAQAAGDLCEEVREWVVSALEGMGPPPRTDIDALTALLENDHPDVAYWAATLLGRLGEEASTAAQRLGAVVSSDRRPASVRQRCAWALGKIGPAAKSALEHLTAATKGPEPRLARLAQKAIEQIQG